MTRLPAERLAAAIRGALLRRGVPAEHAATIHEATDLIAKGLEGNGPMLINVAIAREFK